MIVALPWTNPPLSGNRTRGNVYAQHAKVEKALREARFAVRAADLAPIARATLTLTLRPDTKRRRDADNLAPTLKVCQDALVLEQILPDDSWAHVPRVSLEIHPPNGQPAAMWLTVEPLEPA